MRSLGVLLLLYAPMCLAQEGTSSGGHLTPAPVRAQADARSEEIEQLRTELARISARLDALERGSTGEVGAAAVSPGSPAEAEAAAHASGAAAAPAQPVVAVATQPAIAVAPPAPPAGMTAAAPVSAAAALSPTGVLSGSLPSGATLNLMFDGYYEYNFNEPPGRVNQLRAYDVLSNTFSINQADVIFERAPDVEAGRRFGVRLDLQFGQATDTLQGSPSNEPRPDVYRNIFQAYGTYVLPVGKGLNVDFGKWASSLGYEGNYTKDQINYTRSYYFYFLPFYHAGVRTSYHFNDRFAVNYWVVNGANQSEPTNGFKDELFGFVVTPAKSVSWTSNYYLGQEHPNETAATNCTGPVQPGLCVAAISPAPNGKLNIFDNYVSWQATPKLSLASEFDYVIEREWARAAAGESSAPSHVTGGVAYGQYQLSGKAALGVRGEYLSDRGGLFSGTTQALKEGTLTYKYTLADGLNAFLEYRRDWTNLPYFNTGNAGVLVNHQDTASMGLVWWYGGKQGSW